MPWHGMDSTMPSLPLTYSSMHNLVKTLPHTLLVVPDTALNVFVHRTRQQTRRPDVPRRAHARQSAHDERHGHAQTRRRPTPLRHPILFSLRHQLRNVTSHRLDKPIGPREPRTQRRHHRRPLQYCELRSRARPRQSLVFTAVNPYIFALTSPSQERHRQCPSAPVDASLPMTSPPRLGHLWTL
jgi:hypothetical protein